MKTTQSTILDTSLEMEKETFIHSFPLHQGFSSKGV